MLRCTSLLLGMLEVEAWLAESLKRLLLTHSPNEHVLQVSYDEEGLLDGATNYLGIL